MTFEIYYHPSVSLINVTVHNKNSWGIIKNAPVESYIVKLNNDEKNLKHLSDKVFYNLRDSYKVSIERDDSIRNVRALNFIRDSIYEDKKISVFILDNSPFMSLEGDNSKRLTIVSFGEEFNIANKHISSSPVSQMNKPLFIQSYYQFKIPASNEKIIHKTVNKF